jgi:signal transduction histidine kinase
VWIDQSMIERSVGAGGTVEVDLCEVGVVVLDQDGRVVSTNGRARELLRAESQAALNQRVTDIQRAIASQAARQEEASDETSVHLPDLGPLGVRSCDMAGVASDGRVLLLRDGRSLPGTANLLQQAARHRTFSFLSRDWAHDLKGMLHVIRINSALLGRLLQRQPPTIDAPVTKCLEAIPREIERLDRAIESMFHARPAAEPTTFDMAVMCQRLKSLIAARAVRQRLEVVLEVNGAPLDIVGFEDQVESALMNVIVNALEAMPEQGRLVISADRNASQVCVRIADSGAGLQTQPAERLWRPHFVNDSRQTGIGLHVTRAIVESHGGRIECASNVPRGTCIEITFPTAASTGRLVHGSRTHC